jgi:hypothetical protein
LSHSQLSLASAFATICLGPSVHAMSHAQGQSAFEFASAVEALAALGALDGREVGGVKLSITVVALASPPPPGHAHPPRPAGLQGPWQQGPPPFSVYGGLPHMPPPPPPGNAFVGPSLADGMPGPHMVSRGGTMVALRAHRGHPKSMYSAVQHSLLLSVKPTVSGDKDAVQVRQSAIVVPLIQTY